MMFANRTPTCDLWLGNIAKGVTKEGADMMLSIEILWQIVKIDSMQCTALYNVH